MSVIHCMNPCARRRGSTSLIHSLRAPQDLSIGCTESSNPMHGILHGTRPLWIWHILSGHAYAAAGPEREMQIIVYPHNFGSGGTVTDIPMPTVGHGPRADWVDEFLLARDDGADAL